MFLESLQISSEGQIIRDIPFNLKGLNLIIDATPATPDKKNSGNNVGKTTFIRCIDFCLGSGGNDLFQDRELKQDNEKVKEFLVDKVVLFTLTTLNLKGEKTVIRRSLVESEDLIIDDIKYHTITEFRAKLTKLFFGLDETVASFRNLIKKFVRCDPWSSDNILRILHSTATNNDYWGVHLTLLGFIDHKLLKTTKQLKDQLAKTVKKLRTVKGRTSVDSLKQKMKILESQIEEKEISVKQMPLPQTYGDLIKNLNELKNVTSDLSAEVSNLSTKISYNRKTKHDLEKSHTHIDPQAIRRLYEEAKTHIPDLQKQFEEVLAFHEAMLLNKIKFIDQHIDKLTKERDSKRDTLNKFLEQQSEILKSLDNSGTFDDLLKIRTELDSLLIDKGKVMNEIEVIEALQNTIDELKDSIIEANKKFDNEKENIKSNTEVFNKYLVKYSESIHGEKPFVFYNSEKEKVEITNLQGNAGKGYKKSDILAFDLAYISFIAEIGLPFPRFVMHDELEIIHHNQIETIFKIANTIDGQLFISVLKEKLDFLGSEFIEANTILTLSQEDKLFRF